MSFLVIKLDDRHLLYFDHMIVDPLNKDFWSLLGYNTKGIGRFWTQAVCLDIQLICSFILEFL